MPRSKLADLLLGGSTPAPAKTPKTPKTRVQPKPITVAGPKRRIAALVAHHKATRKHGDQLRWLLLPYILAFKAFGISNRATARHLTEARAATPTTWETLTARYTGRPGPWSADMVGRVLTEADRLSQSGRRRGSTPRPERVFAAPEKLPDEVLRWAAEYHAEGSKRAPREAWLAASVAKTDGLPVPTADEIAAARKVWTAAMAGAYYAACARAGIEPSVPRADAWRVGVRRQAGLDGKTIGANPRPMFRDSPEEDRQATYWTPRRELDARFPTGETRREIERAARKP